MDLPYKAEYAKSGRASCKGCKTPIAQESLRLAVMVQSPRFDAQIPNWYHQMCFFSKQKPKTVDDIANFETLRYEDQQKIKEKVSACGSSGIVVPSKKGKKRDAESLAALKDFVIEYSKSSRAVCRGCEIKVMKDEVRISKKDFESDVGKRYGGQDKWHHVPCFAQMRVELGYFESGDKLPGFKSLKKSDQDDVKKQLPAIKQEDVPDVKKVKKDEDDDPLEEEIRKQNEIMYKYRDQLKSNLKKSELLELLEANGQDIPEGVDAMLDRLCDVMTFGALEPCKLCGGGQFVYDKGGYLCHGNASEWSKCNTFEKTPKRRKFTVPKSFSAEYPFLKKYKYTKRDRVVKEVLRPSASVKKEEEDETDSLPKVQREKPALYEMKFVLIKTATNKDELKKRITKLGGKVVTRIDETVMAVVSTEEEVEKMSSRIMEAKDEEVHVVPEKFIDEAANNIGKIPELVKKLSICDWGSDPTKRVPEEPSVSHKSKSKSIYTKSVPSKVKLTLKGGTAVDPDSGLEKKAHVYIQGKDKYTAVLGITDIQKQKNSYYKLQLLESDQGQRYWVFRAWGRIGTTIGSNKLEPMETLYEAKSNFMAVYEEKTGNRWDNRDNFVKVPGKMYPVDVEYEDDSDKMEIDSTVESKLAEPVQQLIKFIFDVKSMQKVMLEFELDTEKMPLGKLSKKQIQSAFGVLTDLQKLIEEKAPQVKLIDASNRFYTFIPHSFGVENPPVLDDIEVIKKKTEMLNSLMELEIAYSLMKGSGTDHGIDSYYEQLKADIDHLERDSDEFAVIDEYVKNTHAPTHDNYELHIVDVFKVKRQGEEKRHKPFRKLPNRQLLWHGSRKTNFAGILSQGLRIAPPEAPVTGYMFGKGIYFADMVTKSANYCCTNKMDNLGLMLLCEVALGEMVEHKSAHYVEKLPKGKHSCKGVGRTYPDPAGLKKLGETEVPAGKPVTVSTATSLLYNEYIVYDVAQVQMKYLLKVDFKYKY